MSGSVVYSEWGVCFRVKQKMSGSVVYSEWGVCSG